MSHRSRSHKVTRVVSLHMKHAHETRDMKHATHRSSVSERTTAVEPVMVRERFGDLQVVASALPAPSHSRWS